MRTVGLDGVVADVSLVSVALIIAVGKNFGRISEFGIIVKKKLTKADIGQPLDAEILENVGGLVELAANGARIKIFNIISVGELIKLTLAALNWIEDGGKNQCNDNHSSGNSNHGKEGLLAPGHRDLLRFTTASGFMSFDGALVRIA